MNVPLFCYFVSFLTPPCDPLLVVCVCVCKIDLHAGGSLFASSKEFSSFAVSKQEYDEFGHTICNMRFADW